MIIELGAVHALRVGEPLRFYQRGAQPVPGGDWQGFGLVVAESVLGRDGPLEDLDRSGEIAGRALNLALENSRNDGQQFLAREETETLLGRGRGLLHRGKPRLRLVNLAKTQRRVALSEVEHAGGDFRP